MILPGYVVTMAGYNGWQNRQLEAALDAVPDAVLRADRGAFFGSILGTLNHLLWGDLMWMSRFAPERAMRPEGGIADSPGLCEAYGDWRAARRSLDGEIEEWAAGLHAAALAGPLNWFSGALGRDVTKPMALCVVHMFNHQTHHRGQVHAMLTKEGLKAPVSDLFAMPEDV